MEGAIDSGFSEEYGGEMEEQVRLQSGACCSRCCCLRRCDLFTDCSMLLSGRAAVGKATTRRLGRATGTATSAARTITPSARSSASAATRPSRPSQAASPLPRAAWRLAAPERRAGTATVAAASGGRATGPAPRARCVFLTDGLLAASSRPRQLEFCGPCTGVPVLAPLGFPEPSPLSTSPRPPPPACRPTCSVRVWRVFDAPRPAPRALPTPCPALHPIPKPPAPSFSLPHFHPLCPQANVFGSRLACFRCSTPRPQSSPYAIPVLTPYT
jgi:hypothetical protein